MFVASIIYFLIYLLLVHMDCALIIWASLCAGEFRKFRKYSRTDEKSSSWQTVCTSTAHLFPLTHQHKQQYQYNNNGKPKPDDIVLYLYTTYDTTSFDSISSISCPMIFEQIRRFCDGDGFQLSVRVKVQIVKFPFWKISKLTETK